MFAEASDPFLTEFGLLERTRRWIEVHTTFEEVEHGLDLAIGKWIPVATQRLT